jgi:ectoine hydroxylase-related dioxygenase (phytanoyl-CoA dioxygenase family)
VPDEQGTSAGTESAGATAGARAAFTDTVELAAETIDAFQRDGHVVVRGLAAPDELDDYRAAVEAAVTRRQTKLPPLAERDAYSQAFVQLPNLWRRDEAIARFVLGARFAKAAADLMGVDGVRIYHDQALAKEAGGAHTPWHQDQVYWPLDTDDTITMWMPLVDVPPEVGSMTFASGSNLVGAVSENPISDESDGEIDGIVAARGFPLDTHGALAAGDATVHAGWTLHRADPNPTDRVLPVMTVIYVADGTVVAEPRSPFQEFDLAVWLPGLAPGDPVDTDLNPRLYPPDPSRRG